jgi:hypothetical protein
MVNSNAAKANLETRHNRKGTAKANLEMINRCPDTANNHYSADAAGANRTGKTRGNQAETAGRRTGNRTYIVGKGYSGPMILILKRRRGGSLSLSLILRITQRITRGRIITHHVMK